MFRQMYLVVCIIGLIVLPATTHAQDALRRVMGSAGGGVTLPLNQGYEPIGIQAEVSVGYQLTRYITGRGGLGYYRLDFDQGETIPGVTQFQSIESIYGALQYSPSLGKKLSPFFLGGAGLYNISRDTRVQSSPVTPLGDTFVGVLEGVDVTKFGVLAGTGLKQVIYRKIDNPSSVAINLFVEGKVHLIFTDEPLKLITVSVGIGISL